VVLYPRDTADVVAIVKVASQFGIPLIPFSGGTCLEGQTGSVGLGNSPKARAKLASGSERVTVDDLEAGRTWVLDFAENMNQVIAIHQDDLDIVVQPGISYGAVNELLAEHAKTEGKNALFFPVDPAPGAMVSWLDWFECTHLSLLTDPPSLLLDRLAALSGPTRLARTLSSTASRETTS